MSTDAIVLLRNDHTEVRKLFREFQKPQTTDARKGAIVTKVIELLTAHTYIENEVMYPRVRALLPDLEDDILESYEEHHVADVLVMELHQMTPKDERFEAKTTVLIENVTHHMDEEEQDWFPKVREGLGRRQLQELGEELLAAKKRPPKHRRRPVPSRRPSTPSSPSDRPRVCRPGHGGSPRSGLWGCRARSTRVRVTVRCPSRPSRRRRG